MFIKEISRDSLVLKEISYGVIFRSVVVFIAALIITINAKNTESASIASLFITGPLLMALSFLSTVYLFKNITINIDTEEIVRSTWRMNKVKEEGLLLEGVSSIEVIPNDNNFLNYLNRTKYNIYLKFDNSSIIKINSSPISKKRSKKIASEICTLLIVPINITEKESIVKTISGIRELFK